MLNVSNFEKFEADIIAYENALLSGPNELGKYLNKMTFNKTFAKHRYHNSAINHTACKLRLGLATIIDGIDNTNDDLASLGKCIRSTYKSESAYKWLMNPEISDYAIGWLYKNPDFTFDDYKKQYEQK